MTDECPPTRFASATTNAMVQPAMEMPIGAIGCALRQIYLLRRAVTSVGITVDHLEWMA